MAFLNPIFLLGMMAAALPVFVHLVRRTRAVRMPYASLMFLRRIEQKTIRKRKLRNLALLALRTLALLLLALAFARPYFPGENALSNTTAGTASVILVDVSYSMRFPNVFERARDEARRRVNEAGGGGLLSVVAFSTTSEIVKPLGAERAEAHAAIDSLQPGFGASDYLQAIQAGQAILRDASAAAKRIYLISDFQDIGWNRAAPPLKLDRSVELVPVDVAASNAANLSVGDIEGEAVVYAQKYAGSLSARVSNFTDEQRAAAVELKLNDLTAERREVRLEASASESIEFTGFNVFEGANRAEISITGDDFTPDNRAFFTIRRENQTRVLAIETATRGRSESLYLQQALAAGDSSQHELTLRGAGSVDANSLDSYRVVIVNDAAVSGELAARLRDFVERGGGLIIAAGKHIDAGDFNRLWGDAAPAQLGETVRSSGTHALMSQVNLEHPIFSVFARGGRLVSPRVFAYHRATPVPEASVIAALDDGSPMLIEKAFGNGRVMLLTTTLDTAWNDLPLSPVFLPVMRRALEYLEGRKEAMPVLVGQTFTAPRDSEGNHPSVEYPSGGRVESARTNADGDLAVTATEAGFYRLRYRDRTEYVAVNVDPREADLRKLDMEGFLSALRSGESESAASEPAGLTPEQIEARQGLWLWLLLLALMLFVAEAVLARRIRLAKMVE